MSNIKSENQGNENNLRVIETWDPAYLSEKPDYPEIQMLDEPKTCCFCHRKSNEIDVCRHLGLLMGPAKITYYGITKHIYFHAPCAIWCPNIYLDPDGRHNKLMNLDSEYRWSWRCICHSCKKDGAGLGCNVDECDKSFHYLCAQKCDAVFNTLYQIWCSDHAHLMEEDSDEDESEVSSS